MGVGIHLGFQRPFMFNEILLCLSVRKGSSVIGLSQEEYSDHEINLFLEYLKGGGNQSDSLQN